MAEKKRPPSPPGKEYLRPYRALMRTIREEYPGFFPALLAAQKAQNEALEFRSTAILRDLPTDEEMAQQLCTEYNLVNRSWPTRTLGTNTIPAGIDASLGPSVESADAQTITDPFPVPMDTDAPGPSTSREFFPPVPSFRHTHTPSPIDSRPLLARQDVLFRSRRSGPQKRATLLEL